MEPVHTIPKHSLPALVVTLTLLITALTGSLYLRLNQRQTTTTPAQTLPNMESSGGDYSPLTPEDEQLLATFDRLKARLPYYGPGYNLALDAATNKVQVVLYPDHTATKNGFDAWIVANNFSTLTKDYFDFVAIEPNSLVIYASGNPAYSDYPIMQVKFNDVIAYSATVSSSLKAYYFTPSTLPPVTQIKVAFPNDARNQATGEDRNLRVDKLIHNVTAYQAESPFTYATGYYSPGTTNCSTGFPRSEWLHCNGYFQFGTAGPSPTPTPRPTNTPTPIPTCNVQLLPLTVNQTQGLSTNLTANVTLLGGAIVDRVVFSTDSTAIATVSPTTDSSYPYTSVLRGIRAGSTTVTASVYIRNHSTVRCSDSSNVNITRPGIPTPTPINPSS